jgi:hypothetical protein
VLGVRETDPADGGPPPTVAAADPTTDGETVPATGGRPATAGGEARVTLGVNREEATALLGADDCRLMARSRGTRREFELVALLRRAGKRFRRVTVREDGPLDGVTIGEAAVRDAYDVVVLAVRGRDGRSAVAPRGNRRVVAGDELVVVGSFDDLDRFAGAVA